jgi:hypothetical protein
MEISLGPLFRRLYKQRGATGLGFVHDEFRRFHGRRNGWIHSRDYAANGAALSGPVSLGDISDRLGVVWRSALRLVETGAVAGTQRAFGRRKSVIVDAAEFTDAARKAGLTAECRRRAEELGAIGTRQVEGLLGVSAGMVKQFQAAGLLGEPIPLAFGILVSGDEVRRLLLRLEDLAASSRRLKGDQSATSGDRRKITRLGLEDHTPAECLRAVIDGGIVPVAVIDSETGLNRFSFELAEVRQSLDAANVRRPAGGKSPR